MMHMDLTKYSHENVTEQDSTEIQTPGMTQPNSLLRHFFFSNVDRLSPMSSDPIMVCFCNSSNMPNCEERSRQYDAIYPGERLVANIATVGYYGGTSAGTVQIQVENASLVGPNGLQGTTVTCRELKFQLDSPSFTTAHIDLTVIGGLPTRKLRIDVSIKSCPPGFHKIQADSPNCQCDPRLTILNVSCHIHHEYSMFQRAGNNWFSYMTKDKCLITFENCPFDYCKRSLLYFDLVHPEGQCNGNRTGILCGQCQAGLSLLLGSNRCGHCNNLHLILLIPVILAAGVVLVVVLLFLKLTVSVGTINGLLFYANMVKLNELVFFPKGSIPVVSQFIAWLNLDLGIETCLYDGLDGYQKIWLQFAFPAYLFLLVCVIAIGCEYSVWAGRLCGSHAVPTLATLFFLPYTKILINVANGLAKSTLVCSCRTISVWSVDGNIDYYSSKHILLVAYCSIVFVFCVVYPLLVIFGPLLERYSSKCIPHKWNPVPRLKPILDAYGGPYKDVCRSWTGMSLMARLIVAAIFYVTNSSGLAFLNSYIIITVALGFIVAASFVKGAYRSKLLSLLDGIFLLNLLIFGVASVSALPFYSASYQQVATTISVSLSVVIFLTILSAQLWLNIDIGQAKRRLGFEEKLSQPAKSHNYSNVVCADKKWQWMYTWLKFSNDRQQKRHEPHHVENREGGHLWAPPDVVYGTQRGQHQFELVFQNPPSLNEQDESLDTSPVLMEREPLLMMTY